MTRLPADAFQIEPLRGEEWPAYRVPTICALDGCSSLNVERHHIVRRSWTVGPYDWVRIGEVAVGNIMPLCSKHHRLITDNVARIEWDEDAHVFTWKEEDGSYLGLSQPPTIEAVRSREPELDSENRDPNCPACGQRVRQLIKRDAHEAKRPRKTWTITVPQDSREMGADVLDTLLESARLILDDHGLSYGQDRGVRYFVLSTALGLFTVHADEILSDG